MARKSRTAGLALTGALLMTGLLTGCTVTLSAEPPAKEQSSEETAKPSETKKPSKQAAPVEGEALAPGATTTGAAQIPFTNYDGKEAVFSHRVVSIEPAAKADADMLLAEVPELKNYDIHLVKVESSYVSGEALPHNAFYTSFKPVDADKDEVQELSVIGYDFCASESIPSPGDDPSAIIRNCLVAAVPKGSPAPAGVAWGAFDTPYAWYDGSPAYIMLG